MLSSLLRFKASDSAQASPLDFIALSRQVFRSPLRKIKSGSECWSTRLSLLFKFLDLFACTTSREEPVPTKQNRVHDADARRAATLLYKRRAGRQKGFDIPSIPTSDPVYLLCKSTQLWDILFTDKPAVSPVQL